MTREGQAILKLLLDQGQLSNQEVLGVLSGAEHTTNPQRPHKELLATVEQLCPPRSLSTYRTGFNRLIAAFGDRPIGDVSIAELDQLCATVRDDASRDPRGRDGQGAVRTLIHAARFFYNVAERSGLVADNPARELRMPPPARHVRRALTQEELADIYLVTASGGNDPMLDLLLLDFHRETAARRAGACSLRIRDLDARRGSALLREKGGRDREIPLSANVIDRVLALEDARRGSNPEGPAFRYFRGSPLTRRRYNTWFDRVHMALPWATQLGVSIHWIRHTTLTDVSNARGSRVAAAYAGHADRSTIDRYTVPSFDDLRDAHSCIFWKE